MGVAWLPGESAEAHEAREAEAGRRDLHQRRVGLALAAEAKFHAALLELAARESPDELAVLPESFDALLSDGGAGFIQFIRAQRLTESV